jgi:hypothetical protein
MTTARRLAANRKNACASTGPKSAAGKKRASRNAHRHGLAVPVWSVPQLAAEAESLARQIAGGDASPSQLELSRRIAEAQIDIARARQLRQDLITSGLSDVLPFNGDTAPAKLALVLADQEAMLAAIDRYERRALARRKFAIRALDLDRTKVMQAVTANRN